MPAVTVPADRSEVSVKCPSCAVVHRLSADVVGKLALMEELRSAICKARPILSDVCVGVSAGDRVIKIPYNLLVGRLPAEMAFAGSGLGRRFIFSDEDESPNLKRGGEKR